MVGNQRVDVATHASQIGLTVSHATIYMTSPTRLDSRVFW